MLRNSLKVWNKQRLRLWLSIFFLALLIPTSLLIYQAYSQLRWEAFHHHRLSAEEQAVRIDRQISRLIKAEEKRPFTDYAFLNVAGDPAANFLQRSPLSAYPVDSVLPGLIGYFQIDAKNNFTTPLLPQPEQQSLNYGVSQQELAQRRQQQQHIYNILIKNQLLQAKGSKMPAGKKTPPSPLARRDLKSEPVSPLARGLSRIEEQKASAANESATKPGVLEQETISGQAAFDRLYQEGAQSRQKMQKVPRSIGRVEDLKLKTPYEEKLSSSPSQVVRPTQPEKRIARKERSALPEQRLQDKTSTIELTESDANALRITMFESEVENFEVSLLASGQLVLYRKVWRANQRFIQGALIEPDTFFRNVVATAFHNTELSKISDIAIAYHDNVLAAYSGEPERYILSSAEQFSGALLYQTRLSAPLADVVLIYNITRLPVGPGAQIITWLTLILFIILCGGFYLMYRLGIRQISLAQQQQDFVSAVSHELKTPLTSIRMYGEMLREGWADEAKRKTYYDYIFDESERLSRLISNVLQLARMTRNDLHMELVPVSVSELIDSIKSKISSQIERSGFTFLIQCEPDARARVIQVDTDAFSQIMINLVDNALKFSDKATEQKIEIGCTILRNRSIQFSVRDHGPGIATDQLKKIFRLFYRSENELTRETVGTGIGLALVHQLTVAMHGKVDVVNCDPGAEFRLSFPLYNPGT